MLPRYGHQFRQMSGLSNEPGNDFDLGDRLLRQARHGRVQFDEAGNASVDRPGFSAGVAGDAAGMLRKVQDMYAQRAAHRLANQNIRGTTMDPMPPGGFQGVEPRVPTRTATPMMGRAIDMPAPMGGGEAPGMAPAMPRRPGRGRMPGRVQQGRAYGRR